jgi:predicted nucleic acid-binding protein
VIVVDTSVWIDFFRGATTPAVERFVALVDDDAGIAITDVILTEILQGLRSEADVRRVERRLSPFEILSLEGLDDFRQAAALYRAARRKGITIRRTLDCLIASVCIREGVALLHTDADFDRLASCSTLRLA